MKFLKASFAILALLAISGAAQAHPKQQKAPFRATATAHSVTLVWIADATTGVVYDVSRATSATGPFVALAGAQALSALTYVDTAVTGGTTYYYELIADCSAAGASCPAGMSGISTPAGPVNATIPTTPPQPVTGFAVTSVQ